MTLVGNRWKVACGSSVLLLNWLECSVFKLQWAKEERKFWIKINSKINNRNIFVIRLTFDIQQCMIELLSSNSFRGNFWFWFPTAGLDRLHLKAPYDYIIFEHTTFFAPKCVKISNCLRLIAANYSLSCWQLNQLTCFGVTKISDGLLAKGSNESGLTSPTHLISWCLGFFYSLCLGALSAICFLRLAKNLFAFLHLNLICGIWLVMLEVKISLVFNYSLFFDIVKINSRLIFVPLHRSLVSWFFC